MEAYIALGLALWGIILTSILFARIRVLEGEVAELKKKTEPKEGCNAPSLGGNNRRTMWDGRK